MPHGASMPLCKNPVSKALASTNLKRRHFLKRVGAVSLALPIACQTQDAAAIDPFRRSKPGRLKLSLAAYSLRKYLAPKQGIEPKMDLFGFVDFCNQQGLPGAELTSYYFPQEVTVDYLLKLRRHCHLRGISVSGGAIRNDFCSRDADQVNKDLQHTRQWIDHYSVLGAPAIRIFAGKSNREEELSATLARCARHCESAAEYAAEKGVLLALENHGGVTAKAEGLLEIVRQVNSSAFGVNFDSGNFKSTSTPYSELEMIAPFAVNAQIKVEIAPNGKKEETDLKRVIEILKDSGYSGWVALEYEAAEEPLDAIPRWLDRLKALI